MVMILVLSSLISFKALYNVVVLPEPVGPVTRMILRQRELPTSGFLVMDSLDARLVDRSDPVIVQQTRDAFPFGLEVVHDKAESDEAAAGGPNR